MERIKQFYKKYGEITSFSIGIIGFVFGIIQYFNPYTLKPELKFFVKESINVVSLNEDVADLQVLFENKNIRRDSLSLKVFKVRLKNTGNVSISTSDFADIPFGLKLTDGRFISYGHDASNLYLKDNVKPSLKDSVELIISKCIIDRNEFVDFEFLIIHHLSQRPTFKAIGKVVDLDQIELVEGQDSDFTWQDFFGSIFALLIVVGGFFIFGLLLVLLGEGLDRLKKSYRKRKVLNYYNYPIDPLNEEKRLIVQMVAELGFNSIKPVLVDIVSNNGLYLKMLGREVENIEAVSKFRALISNQQYYAKDIKAKDIHEYTSNTLRVINWVKKENLCDEADTKVKDSLLREFEVFLKKYQ